VQLAARDLLEGWRRARFRLWPSFETARAQESARLLRTRIKSVLIRFEPRKRCARPRDCRGGANAKARRGFPSGLGHSSEGYPFMREPRFNVQRTQVAKLVARSSERNRRGEAIPRPLSISETADRGRGSASPLRERLGTFGGYGAPLPRVRPSASAGRRRGRRPARARASGRARRAVRPSSCRRRHPPARSWPLPAGA
jgi:hypothetical protein